MLQDFVDCQRQIISVFCSVQLVLSVSERISVDVRLLDASAVDSGKFVVKLLFNSAPPRIIRRNTSDELCG